MYPEPTYRGRGRKGSRSDAEESESDAEESEEEYPPLQRAESRRASKLHSA